MRDRESGRSRGFGFVTYGSAQEAEAAISGLNEQELDGRYASLIRALARILINRFCDRRIKVNLANARGGGAGGGGGGGGGETQFQNKVLHF